MTLIITWLLKLYQSLLRTLIQFSQTNVRIITSEVALFLYTIYELF